MSRKALLRDIQGKPIRHHKAYVTGGNGAIRVPTKLQEKPEALKAPEMPVELEVVEEVTEELDVDIIIEEVEEVKPEKKIRRRGRPKKNKED